MPEDTRIVRLNPSIGKLAECLGVQTGTQEGRSRENPYVIEAQLAHKVPDPLGRAYNRTTHLPERRRMMQRWADYLDKLKAGAVVVPFTTAKGR